jgi:hypothetical protein
MKNLPDPLGGDGIAEAAQFFRAAAGGRVMLKIGEFAEAVGLSWQKVSDLIEEGQILAVDMSSATATRKCWRIPVCAVADFLEQRKN